MEASILAQATRGDSSRAAGSTKNDPQPCTNADVHKGISEGQISEQQFESMQNDYLVCTITSDGQLMLTLSDKGKADKKKALGICNEFLVSSAQLRCEKDVHKNRLSYQQIFAKWAQPIICTLSTPDGKILTSGEDIMACNEICSTEENPAIAQECSQDFIAAFGEAPTFSVSGVCTGKARKNLEAECNKKCQPYAERETDGSLTAVKRKEISIRKCVGKFK